VSLFGTRGGRFSTSHNEIHDTHREASILTEESDQLRFLRATHLVNLKDSVGLILVEDSPMGFTIPIDLSTRSFIPLPRFLNSRRPTPLLTPSLVLLLHHSV
jgi:hypothetical protein